MGTLVRRHGRAAIRHQRADSVRSKANKAVAEILAKQTIDQMMWEARAIREVRIGACVVAGPKGEVLRVDAVALSGDGAILTAVPSPVANEILKRMGPRWVEKDLQNAFEVKSHEG